MREPRWLALTAFVTGCWLPATTARRTQHVSLPAAFLVHILAAVVICAMVVLMIAWVDPREFRIAMGLLYDEIAREYRRHKLEMTVATAAVILSIEAGFVMLALLVGSWGAVDERFRDSIRNALRQTWLHTAAAVPLFAAVCLFVAGLLWASQQWRRDYNAMRPVMPAAPTPPTLPRSVSPDSPGWKQYQEQVGEYQKQIVDYQKRVMAIHLNYSRMRPWYLRHHDEAIGLACMVAGVWAFWALMRAVGAKRGGGDTHGQDARASERPPMCESCGYNLTLMPLEARCPECGEPVIDSLGPEVRQGTAWERRREVGRFRAWWRTGVDAALRPGRLGRQIRVSSRMVAHRWFLVGHALTLVAIGYFVLLACFYADMRRDPFEHAPDVAYIGAPVTGVAGAASAVVAALIAAGVVGVYVGWPQRRNLIPAAMQVAGYLGAYLVVGYCFSGLLAITMFYANRERWFRGVAERYRIDREAIAVLGWLVPTLAIFVVFFVLVYRGTMAARYANR